MINLSLKGDPLKKLAKALEDSPKEIGKRTERALNKTAAKHKTQISKKVREIITAKAAAVKDVIEVEKALSPHKLSAVIHISQTKRLGLIQFKHRLTKKGVVYKIEKTGTQELIKGAFKIESKGGHIFRRKNKYNPDQTRKYNRATTAPLRGTTVYNVFTKHKLERWSKKTVRKELAFQVDQQIKNYLKYKLKKK